MGTRNSGRGRNIVSRDVAQRASAMIAEGRSKAATAEALQISTRTVYRIAGGKHVTQLADNAIERCKGCGAKPTALPCRTCEVRRTLTPDRAA